MNLEVKKGNGSLVLFDQCQGNRTPRTPEGDDSIQETGGVDSISGTSAKTMAVGNQTPRC